MVQRSVGTVQDFRHDDVRYEHADRRTRGRSSRRVRPEYLRRRGESLRRRSTLRPGDVAPHIDYTSAETQPGRPPSDALGELHRQHACAAYLDGVARFDLPTDQSRSWPRCPGGCRTSPGGASRRRLGWLRFAVLRGPRRSTFPLHAVRAAPVRPAVHAGARRDPRGRWPLQLTGELAVRRPLRRCGAASRRADDDALQRFSRAFWFTLEFGVVWEDGDLKAYGAGLLSSFGEMNAYRRRRTSRLGPRRDGRHRLRHQRVPAGALPGSRLRHRLRDLTAWFDAI